MSSLTVLSLLCLSLAAGLCTPLTDQQMELKRGDCPMFWYSFNGRCYKYISTKMTWARAELHCVSQGANLVSIHSEEEQSFIRGLIKSHVPEDGNEQFTWIGLSDHHLEGEWMWSDGSKVDFTNWLAEQPDNAYGGEDCVHTRNNADEMKWNDLGCQHKRAFVCAYRLY